MSGTLQSFPMIRSITREESPIFPRQKWLPCCLISAPPDSPQLWLPPKGPEALYLRGYPAEQLWVGLEVAEGNSGRTVRARKHVIQVGFGLP
eukprot:6050075-Amphidinium_carterae.1